MRKKKVAACLASFGTIVAISGAMIAAAPGLFIVGLAELVDPEAADRASGAILNEVDNRVSTIEQLFDSKKDF